MTHFANALILMTCPLLGQATEYSYDNLNRLSKATYANGDAVTYNYDAGGNIIEIMSHTQNPDADGDGMPDSWEIENHLDPYDTNDANSDYDGDGKTNLVEYQNNTNPNDSPIRFLQPVTVTQPTPLIRTDTNHLILRSKSNQDTDNDGMPDSDEIKYKTNPKDDSDCPTWYCQGFSRKK